jgi:hypothetical protein
MPKSSAPLVIVMKNQVSYWTCTFQTCLRGQLLEPYMEQLIMRTSGFFKSEHIEKATPLLYFEEVCSSGLVNLLCLNAL